MTQMATETIIETVVPDLTAHEFDICCDVGPLDGGGDNDDCSRPARWLMWRKCCGNCSLACDQCKDDRVMNRTAVLCHTCDTYFFDAPDCYMYIEPLSRA